MLILSILFGASLAISISGTLILGGLLLVAVVTRAYRGEKWGGPISLLEGALWGLLVWVTLTTVFLGAAGIGEALSWQSACLVFFFAARFLHSEELSKSLNGYVVAASLAGLWGIIQPLTGIVFDPNIPAYHYPDWAQNLPPILIHYLAVNVERAVGPRSHPLTYAETIFPALLLISGWLITSFRQPSVRKKQICLAVGAVFIAGGLVASESRGVWLGTGLGLFILSFTIPIRYRLILFGSGMVAILMVLTVSPVYRARAVSIVSFQSGRSSDRQSSEIRFQLWKQSIEKIREKPVTGWGLKAATLHTIDPVFNKPKTWTESHDIFLQTAMESGLVGLIFFLIIWMAALRQILCMPIDDRYLYLAVWAGFLVAGFTESWTRDKEVAFLFWGFIGLIARTTHETKRNHG